MDNKSYLASIAAPAPAKKPSIFRTHSNLFRILIIIITIFIAFIIFANFSAQLKNRLPASLASVTERSTQFKTILEKYHKSLKSSDLHSYNSTLIGVVSDLAATTKKFSEQHYKSAQKFTLPPSETAILDTIKTELETARISDLLDRRYPINISYYISLLLSSLKEIRTQTKSEKDFTSDLLRLINSLESISSDLNSYSNPTT